MELERAHKPQQHDPPNLAASERTTKGVTREREKREERRKEIEESTRKVEIKNLAAAIASNKNERERREPKDDT